MVRCKIGEIGAFWVHIASPLAEEKRFLRKELDNVFSGACTSKWGSTKTSLHTTYAVLAFISGTNTLKQHTCVWEIKMFLIIPGEIVAVFSCSL